MTTVNPVDDPCFRPWPALWALSLGFFMILVDSTIVSVATPALMSDLSAGVNEVVWVTSAYLLSYAVPLLVTGRLGDRLGQKQVYLAGLTLFTLSSIWCGLTSRIELLIAARVVQGLGASLMAPQTMATITRIFPAHSRGQAMGFWGAVAGLATLVGPILGGVLVDALGWEWIFFINVPVGIVGFVLAWRLVPTLPRQSHRFDVIGVALSAIGMFCLVFGIQEGQSLGWDATVRWLIGAGTTVLVVFVGWQAVNRREPLVPLALFRDRNFSLANVAIATVGFGITALTFPLMLYAQGVRGYSPTQAALLLVPMAVISGALAPLVGRRLVDRVHPRYVAGVGLTSFVVSLVWLSQVMQPDRSVWHLLAPIALLGVANGFMWSPLSTTANRNLPLHQAGAGAGVYNTMRQVGAVLGSAGIAVLMESRLAVELRTPSTEAPVAETGVETLPPALHEGFAAAMGQSMLLPAGVLLVGLVAALSFARPRHLEREPAARAAAERAPAG